MGCVLRHKFGAFQKGLSLSDFSLQKRPVLVTKFRFDVAHKAAS